jgi:hypothetical protein
MIDMQATEFNYYTSTHKEKFGVEPNVIGLNWQYPEEILEGIKKAIDDDKPYDECLMLSKEDRKAWDDGNLFF